MTSVLGSVINVVGESAVEDIVEKPSVAVDDNVESGTETVEDMSDVTNDNVVSIVEMTVDASDDINGVDVSVDIMSRVDETGPISVAESDVEVSVTTKVAAELVEAMPSVVIDVAEVGTDVRIEDEKSVVAVPDTVETCVDIRSMSGVVVPSAGSSVGIVPVIDPVILSGDTGGIGDGGGGG